MKSDTIKRGIQRAPHRSLLRACGLTDDDFEKPFIGIANSYTDIVPGHIHLRELAEAVKEGVNAAGGVAFEFNTMAICDGIAMNHDGMKYSLASREIVADTVESMAMAHALDGLVLLPTCDKIVPGMLMAAARLDIPAIVVTGGVLEQSAQVRCQRMNWKNSKDAPARGQDPVRVYSQPTPWHA